ncbi:MAG: hypothetical protein JNN15_06600 [Blastocatellia bacterium]|nr:hypothetical protein [Blastocatellia bacterium]
MKEQVEKWLESVEAVSGVVMYGVCLPDRSIATRVFDKNFSTKNVEIVWKATIDTFKLIHLHKMAANSLNWVFKELIISAFYSEGLIFGAIARKSLSKEELEVVKRVLESLPHSLKP